MQNVQTGGGRSKLLLAAKEAHYESNVVLSKPNHYVWFS